jgi:hypothetical protein
MKMGAAEEAAGEAAGAAVMPTAPGTPGVASGTPTPTGLAAAEARRKRRKKSRWSAESEKVAIVAGEHAGIVSKCSSNSNYLVLMHGHTWRKLIEKCGARLLCVCLCPQFQGCGGIGLSQTQQQTMLVIINLLEKENLWLAEKDRHHENREGPKTPSHTQQPRTNTD